MARWCISPTTKPHAQIKTFEKAVLMSKAKKIFIAVVAIVLALLVAVDIAVSGYLVNYAIGRAGDGGDRNAEEVMMNRGRVFRSSIPTH